MSKSKEEGPRAFAVFISQVDEGSLHDEASSEVQAMVRSLCDYANRFGRAGKGTITMTLDFAVDAKGVAAVTGSLKTKPPKVPKVSSQFFLTPSGNLTLENPRQQKLPLREVKDADVVRDMPLEQSTPARSV